MDTFLYILYFCLHYLFHVDAKTSPAVQQYCNPFLHRHVTLNTRYISILCTKITSCVFISLCSLSIWWWNFCAQGKRKRSDLECKAWASLDTSGLHRQSPMEARAAWSVTNQMVILFVGWLCSWRHSASFSSLHRIWYVWPPSHLLTSLFSSGLLQTPPPLIYSMHLSCKYK